jgi:ADP-ribose pyrophosphatase
VKFEHASVTVNDRTVMKGGWADPPDYSLIDFTESSGRLSFAYAKIAGEPMGTKGAIMLDGTGLPLNPEGRTGMIGRGLLGKWGPNYAADPIVTRYTDVITTGGVSRKILQMVAIRRKDTQHWAIPGGMVDDGETVSATLRNEFQQEASNIAESGSPAQVLQFNMLIEQLFCPHNARLVYQGYVTDPRNTDNAWIETSAIHYHCTDELGKMLELRAGDDADAARWLTIDIHDKVFKNIYANHMHMVLHAKKQMEYNDDTE